MKFTQKSEPGFSLVEMAIVMVIIGLVVAAITVGKSTMKSANTMKAFKKVVEPCVAAVHEGIRNGMVPMMPSVATINLGSGDIGCTFTTNTVTVTNTTESLRHLMTKQIDNGVDVSVEEATVVVYAPGGDAVSAGGNGVVPEVPTPPVGCAAEFCDNLNGTVTHGATGLVLLKNANCFGRKTWDSAVGTTAALASGSCGLTDGSKPGDWRLSTTPGLSAGWLTGRSPSAIGKAGELEILWAAKNNAAFTGVQTRYYWSSSTDADITSDAWNVHLSNGGIGNNVKALANYVWPVRGGQ